MQENYQSQNNTVRQVLESGGTLTPLDAILNYGIERLAARINDLRNEGMAITTTMVKEGRKRFARYSKTVELQKQAS